LFLKRASRLAPITLTLSSNNAAVQVCWSSAQQRRSGLLRQISL
jgi:hypothetical protein